jgi:flagellar biosynthetic protein FliR
MNELTNWLMVFLRISALLSIFPIFSAANFPVSMRLALGALIAALVSPMVPIVPVMSQDVWGLVGTMAMEVLVGLAFGFAARMIFFALDIAGTIISSEIGLTLSPSIDPMSGATMMAPGQVLYYLAAMLWLSLDLHHWMLLGFARTYAFLPIGGAHMSSMLALDIISRTSSIFVIALQLSAPIMAVSFIISMVFSVLGRAVPAMNVFHESYAVRTLAGLSVFGLTMQLMSQHIVNYLHRLPEDMLTVAQLLHSA